MADRECSLWNDGWQFLKQPVGSSLEQVQKKPEEFIAVNLPHDYLIYNTDDLYEDSMGWYRKAFDWEKDSQKRYELYFEGVYMDTQVFLNGTQIGEWKNGYSSFFFDITDSLIEGRNELLLCVTHQSPNSRWYSGAGIYRNVYLLEHPLTHFVTDSLYITPQKKEDGWYVKIQAEVMGEISKQAELSVEITDGENRIVAVNRGVAKTFVTEQSGEAEAVIENGKLIQAVVKIASPMLWNLEQPALYHCCLRLTDERNTDVVQEKFGFRELSFDTEKGMSLNGKHVKLNGACEHHDLGALGAAFHKSAMRRKLEILRKMGVNAIRCTHNMPAVGLLELCDEMGFLVVDEAFDMWERSKTEYDYARFFPAWWKQDVRSWVRRDRNHPCVILWSIGNEIYDTHVSERGQEITGMLAEETRKHDPDCHAQITIGSNFMPWENARRCADIVKFAGYNYGEKYYEQHHKEHPDWFIYGSETSSTVQSRGIYHFPYKQSVLSDEDEQCSALGNSTTSWGAKSSESCIITERDHDFSMGQFLWSGFDYIGEPTPYHTRNSYFGQVDTAGFPKDSYYIYQSAWTDVKIAPMVHVFPYWDFNPGQMIDVRVASNAPVVELLVNGVSQGEYTIDHAKGKQLTGNWQVPYEKGEITAIAYDEKHQEIARQTRHSFGNPVKLLAEVYQFEKELSAEEDELAFVTISAVDEEGHPVENANNMVHVTVEGNGWLTGLDNGDSTDTDQYKGSRKRLFSGKLLAIVAKGAQKGKLTLTARAKGLEPVIVEIPVTTEKERKGRSFIPESFAEEPVVLEEEWVRNIVLTVEEGNCITPERPQLHVTARILPKEAADFIRAEDLIWKTVNDAGIESPIAKVEPESLHMSGQQTYAAKVTAFGDGNFRLRCMVKNTTDKVKIISQLEFQVSGMGEALLNPYGFIAGGMYTYVEGEAGNGNEHGVSTARDGRTVVGYDKIDFGSFGSDRITLPVFELAGEPCPIEIWEGIPEAAESELLGKVLYHKPSIWNTYQEETYTLQRRVKGITQISFVLKQKIHLKGFSFTPIQKAFEKLYSTENDAVYGDAFTVREKEISDIGNNVTIEYYEMDFGDDGCSSITICGRTLNDANTIHISFADETGETRQLVEFTGSTEKKEMTFRLEKVTGKKTVRFIFMPGSRFDFAWFRFA